MASKQGSAIRVLREEMIPQTTEGQQILSIAVPMPDRPEPIPSVVQSIPQPPASPRAQSAPTATPAGSNTPRLTKTTEETRWRDLSRAFQTSLGIQLVVSQVLAVRLMLLVAVLIAGALAWKTLGMVQDGPTLIALSINGAFDALVVVPIVALYWRRG